MLYELFLGIGRETGTLVWKGVKSFSSVFGLCQEKAGKRASWTIAKEIKYLCTATFGYFRRSNSHNEIGYSEQSRSIVVQSHC